MKVLVTGGGGQVATALLALKPKGVEAFAFGRTELDVGDREAVFRAIDLIRPDLLINAAAYTAVDMAESEPDVARRVNGAGPGYLAEAAETRGFRLFQISTDFVFDGEQSRPYGPGAAARPLGVYGESKLEGERRVQAVLGDRALILRTAWVYASKGRNFVRTMLRLMAERGSVRVVADQVGTPTWANSLAEALWAAAEKPQVRGIHHWTDAGVASWYDFAVAIAEEAHDLGILKQPSEVESIAAIEYPTPAKRPAYSVLDRSSAENALGLKPAHWRVNLRKMLRELGDA